MDADEARARLDDLATKLDALEVNTAQLHADLNRLLRLVEAPLTAYLSGGTGAALTALARMQGAFRAARGVPR